MPEPKRIPFRVILLLIVIWGTWSIRIGQKYYSKEDASRVWMPSAVRNYDWYGVEKIGLSITRNSAPVDNPLELTYYHNHPPLAIWLPALFTKFAGFNELSMRFLFPAAMMIAAAAFYVLVRRLYDSNLAFWSLLFFALSPMISYYETVYGHDPLGLMAAMLFASVFINWLRKPSTARYFVLVFLTILAVYTAWPAVFFVGTIGIVGMLLANNQQRIGIVILGVITVVAIVVMLTSYELMHNGSVLALIVRYQWRSSDASYIVGSRPFSMPEWFANAIVQMTVWCTASVMILSVIGVQPLFKRITKQAKWMIFALFFASLAYQLAFRNASYIHNYYKAFFMPSLAICSAGAILYARQLRIRHLKPFIDVMLISFFVQSVAILMIAIPNGYDQRLDAIINYINKETTSDTTIAIHFSNPGVLFLMSHTIEFYTKHQITPLQTLEDYKADVLIDCGKDTENPSFSDCIVLRFDE